MRKCGNKCLYRRVLAGALSVLLGGGHWSHLGGKAETGNRPGGIADAGWEQVLGQQPRSANGSDIELQQVGSGQSGSAVSRASLERYMQPGAAWSFLCEAVFRRLLSAAMTLIQVQDDSTYLVVPEGLRAGGTSGIYYRFAEAARTMCTWRRHRLMDLIAALDRTDRITLSRHEGIQGMWKPQRRPWKKEPSPMRANTAPDYEQILSSGCDLAESTMIYHVPDVKAQLEQLKIPVFVERSSYETHPLEEWSGSAFTVCCLMREEKAEQLLKEQAEQADTVLIEKSTGKTVAFSISRPMAQSMCGSRVTMWRR